MTDYKQLCVELLSELENAIRVIHAEDGTRHISGAYPVINKVKNTLAEPEPEGPTDIEIASILKAYAVVEPQMGASRILHEKHFSNAAHAILACLGNHQGMLTSSMPQPIPVIKRRPRLEDCDAEGRCWWGAPAYPDLAPASWRFVSTKDRFSSELYWLPANAIPTPRSKND